MHRLKVVVLLFLVLDVFLTSDALAKLPLTYLCNLVESADWIVIGTVVTIEDGEISKEYGVPTRVARIQPERFLNGSKQESFLITFTPSISEEPDFVPKETYLLFLGNTSSGVAVSIGYLGALRINDGLVKTGEIHGEPESQRVDILADRIINMVRENRKTRDRPRIMSPITDTPCATSP